MEKTETGDPG